MEANFECLLGDKDMYCENCGKKVDGNSRYCAFCGSLTEDGSAKVETNGNVAGNQNKNLKGTEKLAINYKFEVKSRYGSLRIYIGILKVIGAVLAACTFVLIYKLTESLFWQMDNLARIMIYIIPCVVILIVFYGMANRIELMLSLEETNRKNNILLRAIFDKLDGMGD